MIGCQVNLDLIQSCDGLTLFGRKRRIGSKSDQTNTARPPNGERAAAFTAEATQFTPG